jgi:hypothetical protein
MRRHRRRRRDGLRCLLVELREAEIDELIHKGFLRSDRRNDIDAVTCAFYEFLDRTLAS